MKKAFTLAETLITFAIIGIVAALTLPSLIQKYNNRIVEMRLKKFYFAVNQAVHMTKIAKGNYNVWYKDISSANDIEAVEDWCNTYLIPYMNVVKTETTDDGYFVMYFSDGSALSPAKSNTRDWIFYPSHIDKCLESCDTDSKTMCTGSCRFKFVFYPTDTADGWKYHYNKGFEPFKYEWDGETDTLLSSSDYGCNSKSEDDDNDDDKRSYCTALIQMNDWKIPDDYPLKVRY